MTHRIRIYRSGVLIRETQAAPGESLLRRISIAGVSAEAPCGGNGQCGKCLVRLAPDGEQVLACRTKVNGDLDVYLPDDAGMQIADGAIDFDRAAADRAASDGAIDFDRAASLPNHPPSLKRKLGVAIDIGTTTVVAHLTDTETCARIATASGVNAQRTCGADVISRIQYCADNGHETLTYLIREQIASLIRQTCAASGERTSDIGYISIAANTIMEHLAAGYSPVGMGVAPFKTVSLFGCEHPVWNGLPAARNAIVYYAPAISAYVGGDITAGILASGLKSIPGPALYLDIGTNGEIVLKKDDIYYCCATAAGPAFEGAEITMGMAAVSGAVNHVKWENGLTFTVIGDKEPNGICGSGLLDALAVLIGTGAVDETGRLLDREEIEHEISDHIEKIDGKNVFWLSKICCGAEPGGNRVCISAMDVRKLQLAKSAISAGIQTLLRHAGIIEAQIKAFVLAGGFGSFMDKTSAARVGLFPMSFLPITQTLGNTAGEGAALALCSRSARDALEDIRKRCEYIELSTSVVFNEQFIEQMMFDEAHI